MVHIAIAPASILFLRWNLVKGLNYCVVILRPGDSPGDAPSINGASRVQWLSDVG